MSFLDGLKNVMSGLKTGRDKAAFAEYFTEYLTDYQAVDIYRGSWLARKIIEIPALDALREWREWSDDAVGTEEQRLNVKGKLITTLTRARLTGSAAILIGADIDHMELPLNPEAIGRGGLKYITVISRNRLIPGPLDLDVSSDNFERPVNYTLTGADNNTMTIHPSRLVILYGIMPVEPTLYQQHLGDSILSSMLDTVKNYDSVMGNIASLVYEAKVDTIGIPNLMKNLANTDYETKLQSRLALVELSKGINGTLVHDADEILGQKQANFSALPDLIEKFMKAASGASDIPMTRLMGQSPAGMSATGESDLRNYYDRIASMQTLEIAPAMQVLDRALIVSAGAKSDASYKWKSLWQVSNTEKADIGSKLADTATKLAASGLVPEPPLSNAVISAISKMGSLPKLQAEMDEYLAANPNDPLADPGGKNV